MKNRKEFKLLKLSFGLLSVSTAAIFIRFAQITIPSITIAAYRLVIACVIMLPFTYRNVVLEIPKLKTKKLVLLVTSGLFLAIHFASWIYSLEFTNVISAVILVNTTPIWVAMLSPFILKTRISKRFLIGLVIAFIGILLIGSGNSGNPFESNFIELFGMNKQAITGNILALLGAVCSAGFVMIGKVLRMDLSTKSYTQSIYSIAAIILCIVAFVIQQNSLIIDSSGIIWLLLMALIPQAIGHSLLNWALGVFPAHLVSVSLLAEPVGTTILAVIFLKENPSLYEYLSGAIVIVGIIIAMLDSKVNSPE